MPISRNNSFTNILRSGVRFIPLRIPVYYGALPHASRIVGICHKKGRLL